MPSDDPNHARLTARRKAGYEHKQARATREKGLLVVFTGPGKGKTTAAFGMALRAIGHGMRVGVVQFLKGAQDSAERAVLSRFENVDFQTIGDGFTWLTQNRERDTATAERAWREAERMIGDPRYDLVILDAPPVLVVSESTVIAAQADGTLMVVWSGRTSRKLVHVSVRQLLSRGATLFGCVLNNLDLTRMGSYGASGYYHYYGYDYRYEEDVTPASSGSTRPTFCPTAI